MTGTHYVDASGLPNPEHYTTARDVALLSRALIRDYPDEYKIYAVKDFEWNGIMQHNRNTLLWRDSTVDGIKTGHTSEAGFCLATSALHGDQRLIAVVMGAPSEKQRADDNQELLNYGFRFFETHKPLRGEQAAGDAGSSGRARRQPCRSASPTTSSSRCRAAATAISRRRSTCRRGSSRRSRRARKSAP